MDLFRLIGVHAIKMMGLKGSPLLGIKLVRDAMSPAQHRVWVIDAQQESGLGIEDITTISPGLTPDLARFAAPRSAHG